MSSEFLGIALDVALIAMLSAALVYGFVLNRKINSLHQSRRELAQLFLQFDSTIIKAQKSVADLKEVANDTSRQLQVRIDDAGVLVNDLSYINDRASGLANKLESYIQQGRNKEFTPMTVDQKTNRIPERKLPELRTASQAMALPEKGSLSSVSTLETLLNKINQRIDRKKAPEAAPEPTRAANPMQSRPSKESLEKTRAENMLKALGLNQSIS